MDDGADLETNAVLAFVFEHALALAAGLATLSVVLMGFSVYLVVRRNSVLKEQRRRATHKNAEPVSQR